jgi:hypothetical protein
VVKGTRRSSCSDGIPTETPLCPQDARRVVARYGEHYNTVRLYSAIGYVTPQAKREGREKAVFDDRAGSWTQHEKGGSSRVKRNARTPSTANPMLRQRECQGLETITS